MQSFKPNDEFVKSKTFEKYYNIYDNPPEDEILFEEFQLNCVRRMQILKFIEQQQMDQLDDQKLNNSIIKKLQDYELSLGSSLDQDHKQLAEKQYKNDEISHFILRVAYSNSDDNINWFVKMETLLFKARLQHLNQYELNKLIQELNIQFENLDKDEFLENKQNILDGCQKFNKPIQNVTNEDFIKVSFLDALMFLPNLKVFVKRGIAYFRKIDLPQIILQHFKKNLQQKMIISQNNYDEILQEDLRAAELLKQLPLMYLGKDYNKDNFQKREGKLTLKNLGYAIQYQFPPCMRNLYEALIKDHHLKHEGRIQLGLFLKGGGLSMEDSMNFWKREFTKKISAEKFEKEYAYNIRHNYGKEGARKDYQPKNCVAIIQKANPGANEHHGCPFKNQDNNNLTKLLQKMGIKDQPHIDIILQKKNDKHYQIACKKTFEIKFPNIFPEGVGQHPNSYLEQASKTQQKAK